MRIIMPCTVMNDNVAAEEVEGMDAMIGQIKVGWDSNSELIAV